MPSLLVQAYQDMIDHGWRRSGTSCYKLDLKRSCCPHYTIKYVNNRFCRFEISTHISSGWMHSSLGHREAKGKSLTGSCCYRSNLTWNVLKPFEMESLPEGRSTCTRCKGDSEGSVYIQCQPFDFVITTIGQTEGEPAPTSPSLVSLHAAEHGFVQEENLAHEYTASLDLIHTPKLTYNSGNPRALVLHRREI
jgi:hypothetical protein